MDDDVKTFLAIVALVYGSSNGIGLLKDRLKPVETNSKTLEAKIGDPRYVATAKDDAKTLLKSIWRPFVVVYVLMVLIVPTFLLLVMIYGPLTVLRLIGLASTSAQPTGTGSSTFYLILFCLSLVATAHYLSEYFKGWWLLLKYVRKKPPVVGEPEPQSEPEVET